MKKNILLLLIAFILTTLLFSCSSTGDSTEKSSPVIVVENRSVYHQGLAPKIAKGLSLSLDMFTSGHHKLFFKIKSFKEIEVATIHIRITNPTGTLILQEAHKPEKPLRLIKDWDFEPVVLLTNDYKIVDLCRHFTTMGDSDGKMYANKVDIIIRGTEGERYVASGLELKMQNSTLFSKIIKAIQILGCENFLWLKEVIGL